MIVMTELPIWPVEYTCGVDPNMYLVCYQCVINSPFLHKLFMSSLFNNSSILNTNNNISCSHGGKSVSDHYCCSAFSSLVE